MSSRNIEVKNEGKEALREHARENNVSASKWGFSLGSSIFLRIVWLLRVRSARKRERSAQRLSTFFLFLLYV
jgi:hypothetical protein